MLAVLVVKHNHCEQEKSSERKSSGKLLDSSSNRFFFFFFRIHPLFILCINVLQSIKYFANGKKIDFFLYDEDHSRGDKDKIKLVKGPQIKAFVSNRRAQP